MSAQGAITDNRNPSAARQSVIVPLLEARGVTMRFGGVTAVDAVDFTLGEVELRCLIGPNGAGKSTFFKMLTGQLKPSAGSIKFRGTEIGGAYPHQIARLGVGIKTQVPNVFDGLSVAENVFVAAGRRKSIARTRAIVDQTLTRLQLTTIGNKIVGHLAHGQRQWVELATVLAQEPKLILLDEPAAGMSEEEVGRTATLIREINLTHALIVVEHDMQFIRQIAKKVTVFNRGQILMEDSAANVLADPKVADVYLGKAVAPAASS
jgi:branched-chain amino acid transport system ATP-binding protein